MVRIEDAIRDEINFKNLISDREYKNALDFLEEHRHILYQKMSFYR